MRKDLFFFASLFLVISFILGTCITFYWPIPQEVWDVYSPPTANFLSFVALLFAVIGTVAFILGWVKDQK